jgi:toxin secretion/phage lysis holin
MDYMKILKAGLAAAGAYISTKVGILGPWLVLILLTFIADYGTGMLSAMYRGLSNSNEGLNSRKGIKGILKKIGYCMLIVVAIMLDWMMINSAPYLGLDFGRFKGYISIVVIIWLFINECISILENLEKMDIRIPPFLLSILKTSKNKIENQDNKGV